MLADRTEYLLPIVKEFCKVSPENRTINIVCHGHSVPAGYTTRGIVRALDAYPNIVRQLLCKRFPFSVANIITSAIGGEGAVQGVNRFEKDTLSHNPDLITIDYALNDRFNCRKEVEAAWRKMIEASLERDTKVLLLTPTLDCGQVYYDAKSLISDLPYLAHMIRSLAEEYNVGLVDSYEALTKKLELGYAAEDFLISVNHPNRAGHEIVAQEIIKWFPLCI